MEPDSVQCELSSIEAGSVILKATLELTNLPGFIFAMWVWLVTEGEVPPGIQPTAIVSAVLSDARELTITVSDMQR